MQWRWTALALAVAVAMLASAGIATAQTTGTVKGKVVNKTPGGEAVGGQSIDLLAFADSGQRDKRTATAGADGGFSFDGLATSGQKYILATKFQGVTYHSEEVDLSKGETTREIELAVYSTTASAGSISVSRSHLIVDYDTDKKNLVVMEMLVFANKGDRAYVGGDKKTADGKPETLRIQLPQGATQVKFNEGLNELQSSVVDGVIVDTAPVPPGQRQIVMGYVIPYQGTDASLVRKLDYPAERMNLLARETSAQITAEGLPSQGTRDMSGTKYVQVSGENVPAGQTISVKFTNIPANVPNPANAGKPPAAAPANDPMPLAAVGVGLVGVGLVLGAAYPILRRRRSQAAAAGSIVETDDEWDNLVEDIAFLDEQFEAGNMDEAEYRRQRAQKKARLQRMGRRLGRA